MKGLHPATCALAFLCVIVAARSSTAQYDQPSSWDAPCLLPSPAAGATFIQDANLRPAGCDQPVSADEVYYPAPANDCDEAYEWSVRSRCVPGWSLYGGGLVLQRSSPAPATIATPPTGTPGVVIGANSFGFESSLGPELILQRTTASGLTWEGRYFGCIDSDAQFLVPNITSFRIAGIGVTILGGGSIDSFYSTRIDNTEINAWKQITPGFSVLAGFRWVELHDTLRSNIATPVTFTQWDERNHLYGGQLGGKLAMFSPGLPFQFDLIGKAGVFGNFAETAFTSTIVAGDTSTASGTSFVGELNLSLSYQFTERLTARAGYMVMWVEGVALAGEAAAATVQVAGGTSSPTPLNGGLWYHGATFGFEYSF